MVSFSCEVCNDTVIKKKLQQHQRSCRGAYFTCIDCSTTFYGNDHQKHTSCISEAEKYEKSLFKGKKGKKQQPQQQKQQQQLKKIEEPKKENKPIREIKSINENKSNKSDKETANISKYMESKETSLYKIFKSLKKDNKNISDKTEFLKNVKIIQNDDGSFNIVL